EERWERGHVGQHGDGLEDAAAVESCSDRPCDVVWRGIDDRQANVIEVGADGISEQNHLQDRKDEDDRERSLIAKDVEELFEQQATEGGHGADSVAPGGCWLSGRVSRTKMSSMEGASNRVLSSAGAPSAARRPATIIEMRSQYSASSR